MNHINDLLSPLHDIVTHKTAGTNIIFNYLNSFLILAAISANSS